MGKNMCRFRMGIYSFVIIKKNMDNIRIQADRYFNRTLLDKKLINSELYEIFFSLQNYNRIIDQIESMYDVVLSSSYRNDVLRTMLTCFEYHPINLTQLNDLVFMEIRPKLVNLKVDRNRYSTNIYENAATTFINPLDLPEQVCNRKESLSFTEALFGRNDKNILAFQRFKTG